MDHSPRQRAGHQHDRLAARLFGRSVEHAKRRQPGDPTGSGHCALRLFDVSQSPNPPFQVSIFLLPCGRNQTYRVDVPVSSHAWSVHVIASTRGHGTICLRFLFWYHEVRVFPSYRSIALTVASRSPGFEALARPRVSGFGG